MTLPNPHAFRPSNGVPRISPFYRWWFTGYGRRYVRKRFDAVRLSRAGLPPDLGDAPVVVYLNHPSWWDPMIGLVIASRYYAGRDHYAPIDEKALAKYAFFSKLGFFPVQPDSRRGALSLLRHGSAILERPRATLWLTPQGRFVDARERPMRFRPGLGHLVRRADGALAVPMALEIVFWNERPPEALARFGEPIALGGADRPVADWTARLEAALETLQDALAEEAMARNPKAFDIALDGQTGVGGVYDLWRRAKAAMRGKAFRPGHDEAAP